MATPSLFYFFTFPSKSDFYECIKDNIKNITARQFFATAAGGAPIPKTIEKAAKYH